MKSIRCLPPAANWPLLMLALAAGCCSSRGLEGVSGTVTLDGQPLAGAIVEFHPSDQSTIPATGMTDAQGQFQLTTYDPSDGAMPGAYKVTVDVPQQSRSSALDFDAQVAPPTAAELAQERLVPEKYRRIDLTPLVVEVPLSEALELSLTSQTP